MKAIDFACRFLAVLSRDPMSPAKRQVLFAVAAGLETITDIARFTQLSTCTCSNMLRQLERNKLVHHIGSVEHTIYLLAPAGKEHIRKLFSFLPTH